MKQRQRETDVCVEAATHDKGLRMEALHTQTGLERHLKHLQTRLNDRTTVHNAKTHACAGACRATSGTQTVIIIIIIVIIIIIILIIIIIIIH